MSRLSNVPITVVVFVTVIVLATAVLIVVFLFMRKKCCFKKCNDQWWDNACLPNEMRRKLSDDQRREDESKGLMHGAISDSSVSDHDDHLLKLHGRGVVISDSVVSRDDSNGNMMKNTNIDCAINKREVNQMSDITAMELDFMDEHLGVNARPQAEVAVNAAETETVVGHDTVDKQHDSVERSVGKDVDKVGRVREYVEQHYSSAVTVEADGNRFNDHLDKCPPSACGMLNLTLFYRASTKSLEGVIHEAAGIPGRDRGGTEAICISVTLLPKKRKGQRKFTIRRDNAQTSFIVQQPFKFSKIDREQIFDCGVRFRVYTENKKHLIGEIVQQLSKWDLDSENIAQWVTLDPRSSMTSGSSPTPSESSSTSSVQSLRHGGIPQLQVGLSYSEVTGRLTVNVQRGSSFQDLTHNSPPETYVKVVLLSGTGARLAQSKTATRKNQPNPSFMETFVFNVASFQPVTLMMSIKCKKTLSIKKDLIGWISFGLQNSSSEELSHWNEILESRGNMITRWHNLLDP